MIRPCPCCGNTEDRELIFCYTTTRAGDQSVWGCVCGMVFCEASLPVDYSQSIYEQPAAFGSAFSKEDRTRLEGVVDVVTRYCDADKSLLDVGCARGGLLDALRDRGFARLTGLDPSPICVAAARERGHHAIRGVLDGRIQGTFDFITLSHVLEHIDDVRGFLRSVLDHLEPSGRVYIEVPDASRHADYSLPFLEFNSEHVNHFCRKTLADTLDRNGFVVVDAEEKVLALANNVSYPVVWAVAERKASVKAMMKYVAQSKVDMDKLNAHLEKELGDAEECIIWGAGEYLCHVTSLVFRHVKVVQIVDRNPAFQGKPAAGRAVEDPSHIRRSCPIVIAALTAAVPSIKKDAEKLGLENKLIQLEFE